MAGRSAHLPWESVKAAVTSITIFSFAQTEPKSLPPDTLYWLKIYLNVFEAGAYSIAHTLWLDLMGSLCSGRKGTDIRQRIGKNSCRKVPINMTMYVQGHKFQFTRGDKIQRCLLRQYHTINKLTMTRHKTRPTDKKFLPRRLEKHG